MRTVTESFVQSSSSQWLTKYYFARAAVSITWIAAAVLVGTNAPLVAAALLVAYPAWDAFANYLDAQNSGGLRSNRTQAFNLAVSVITSVAVAGALFQGMSAVIIVFGAWAILSGLLQLATAVRRWRSAGAQWLMVLSGAQSALAGAFFFAMAFGTEQLSIGTVAPYAAFGAFYFLGSAIWLKVKDTHQRSTAVVG